VQPVLEVRSVAKRYRKKTALDDVSFALRSGRVYGILGPNGSGKSTLLHIITGLISPDGGEVLVASEPITKPSARSRLGFAPDDIAMPTLLTGREFLQLHDRLRRRDDSARAGELAAAFDLTDALDRQLDEYSHGMKRKIQLVAAVMHLPDLLILDEPLRGLDPDSVSVLRHLVSSLAGMGHTVLIATHDMARAQDDCDEVLIMNEGRLIAQDTPAAMMSAAGAPESLERTFFQLTGRMATTEAKKSLIDESFQLEEV
jgi:ABC-2 type transport system ATP-binding protein